MSLNRVNKLLNASSKQYQKNNIYDAFTLLLECLNVLPHKSSFSEAEYPPNIILKRYKLECKANEILANIYYRNSTENIFEMSNASTPKEMKVLALKSWQIVINISKKFWFDRELQLRHLKIIPQFLSVSNELNKIDQKETIQKILEMIKISKQLYDNLSLEKANIFNSIIDLMVIYCPSNIALLETLSTDILFTCSRPIMTIKMMNDRDNLNKLQKLINNAQTKLLQLWMKQSVIATLKLCEIIAYTKLSNVIIKKDLQYFTRLKIQEIPDKELYNTLKYFNKKLSKNESDFVYGNLLIIRKLINSDQFVRAAKLIEKVTSYINKHKENYHVPVHIACLKNLFVVECNM